MSNILKFGKVGRIWRNARCKQLPPDEGWLIVDGYAEGGWSFDQIVYDEDKDRGLDPGDCKIIVNISDLILPEFQNNFRVLSTPIPGNNRHCDLAYFTDEGVQLITGSQNKSILRKFRKKLLNSPVGIFYKYCA